ncbi:MAG: YbjQ family protein [Methyloprofundus sp.]|nr:YbjQ family protein [Methyloprofundus sp.]
MQFSTTPDIPGKIIKENLGIVAGNVVQSKHVGRDLMAGLKGLIGGEIVGYTEMLADARDVAIERMVDEAKKRGADAIINIRFTTSNIMANASEILAYGTAVKLEKQD